MRGRETNEEGKKVAIGRWNTVKVDEEDLQRSRVGK